MYSPLQFIQPKNGDAVQDVYSILKEAKNKATDFIFSPAATFQAVWSGHPVPKRPDPT